MATYKQTVESFRNELAEVKRRQDEIDANHLEHMNRILENQRVILERLSNPIPGPQPQPGPQPVPGPAPQPTPAFGWPEHTAGMTFEQAMGVLRVHKSAADRQAESATVYEEYAVEIGVKWLDRVQTELIERERNLIEGVLRNRGLL